MTHSFKIAIVGLGTVGCGVIDIIQNHGDMLKKRTGRPIEIVAINARSKSKDRGIDLSGYDWCDNPLDLADRDDVDCILELIGGEDGTAKDLCEAAIENKKHVVTANKALLAHHGSNLFNLAKQQSVHVLYEAAICGGIPVVKALREGLSANKIVSISGILNGTCNYILSTMETTGRDFEDVLSEAQSLGYAETPPDLDIDGIDAAHKICLLQAIGFDQAPDFKSVQVEGIRTITARDIRLAKEKDCVIRLIGSADSVTASIAPQYIPVTSPLAGITGPQNAVLIQADPVGDIFLTGAGAGRGPTASAVMADVVDLARSNG